jgi:hypothetical protein
MDIKYFLREYIKQLPYIVILMIIGALGTYIFHGHMVIRELLVNAVIINVFVMYWSRWFPAHGEFCLRESLLSPVLFMAILVLPLSLYIASRYVPCSGEYIKMDSLKYLYSVIFVAVLIVVLDKSRYANN